MNTKLIFKYLLFLVSLVLVVGFSANKNLNDKTNKLKKIVLLKNNISCKDCFYELIAKINETEAKKYFLVSIDKTSNASMEKAHLKASHNLSNFKLIVEKNNQQSLGEIEYNSKSYFKKYNIKKTPALILNFENTEDVWQYERIFCYGNTSINDTLLYLLKQN